MRRPFRDAVRPDVEAALLRVEHQEMEIAYRSSVEEIGELPALLREEAMPRAAPSAANDEMAIVSGEMLVRVDVPREHQDPFTGTKKCRDERSLDEGRRTRDRAVRPRRVVDQHDDAAYLGVFVEGSERLLVEPQLVLPIYRGHEELVGVERDDAQRAERGRVIAEALDAREAREVMAEPRRAEGPAIVVAEDRQELDVRAAQGLDDPVEEGPRARRRAEEDVIAEQERDGRTLCGDGGDDRFALGIVLLLKDQALDEGRALQIRGDRDPSAFGEGDTEALRGRSHA